VYVHPYQTHATYISYTRSKKYTQAFELARQYHVFLSTADETGPYLKNKSNKLSSTKYASERIIWNMC